MVIHNRNSTEHATTTTFVLRFSYARACNQRRPVFPLHAGFLPVDRHSVSTSQECQERQPSCSCSIFFDDVSLRHDKTKTYHEARSFVNRVECLSTPSSLYSYCSLQRAPTFERGLAAHVGNAHLGNNTTWVVSTEHAASCCL